MKPSPAPAAEHGFEGFTPLDANYVYCPNQFLDVCLPQASRGMLRLVAYILDQTLGWLDSEGHPVAQNISVSYNQLIHSAGISRGAIRQAIDAAVAARFIRCVGEGRSAASGRSAQQATYALRWDEDHVYQDTSETFQGFYAGDGHRTPIPNAFFRQVIPSETLTVTKVVGTVLRHTVGYQNQFGGRRSQAPLSYRFIQEYAHIPDPKTLRQALSSAIASQYIVCVEEGRFHTDAHQRMPATYAIRWLHDKPSSSGSNNPAGNQTKHLSNRPVQNTQRDQFKNPSSSGSENPAGERFKNPSKEKTEQKDTLKQQTAAAESGDGFRLLVEVGFDRHAAQRLSATTSGKRIAEQIAWLTQRNIQHSRLGMLRKAIEENWPEPDQPADIKAVLRERRERDRQHELEQQQHERDVNAEKARRRQRRTELQKLWDELSESEQQRIEATALEQQASETLKRLLRKSESHRLRACLDQLDRERKRPALD